MTSQLVSQGTLNRLRGSVVIPDFPGLNVTAPFLGDGGIGLSLEGETTTMIPTLTGTTTSPEPYQMCSLTVHLLKTQSLSDSYKKQMETLALIGDVTVRPDAKTLSPYPLLNCAINSVAPLTFNGKDAGFLVTIKGYYQINNSLYDG